MLKVVTFKLFKPNKRYYIFYNSIAFYFLNIFNCLI